MVAAIEPKSEVVPAIVKFDVEVRVTFPLTTPTRPANVTSFEFPRAVWAADEAAMVIFRPSAAVSVSLPEDTAAFTPVVDV